MDNIYTYSTVALGSDITLKLFNPDENIVNLVFRNLKLLEDTLTVNKENSEVMSINQYAGLNPVKVSSITFNLIKIAKEYSLRKDNCFNIAIGPIVQLWKIGFSGKSVPLQDKINELLEFTDPNEIILDDKNQTVYLSKKNMFLDLGAIAKGYIADILRALLISYNINNALINLGGNVLTIGNSIISYDGYWSIGLQKPFANRDDLIGIIKVSNKAVVTSGIYERYFEVDGKVYHHILDPQTGAPLDNELDSVTVISDDSIIGDIYSSYFYGLGVKNSMGYLQKPSLNIQIIFVTKQKEIILSLRLKSDFKLLDSSYTLVFV